MSASAVPVPAAGVILLRDGTEGPEVFLLRRHAAASFMADQFVFPGGRIDEADGGPRRAAIRELFEEAGVLLAEGSLPADAARWRRRLLAGEVSFDDFLESTGALCAEAALRLWGRWITPSALPNRFDTWFYAARLPPGQTPSIDVQEAVAQIWVTPAAALARQEAGALPMPPPQLATLAQLAAAGFADTSALLAALERGGEREAPVLPRAARDLRPRTLLFPWDPDYERLGEGDSMSLPAGHALAHGPSRVVLDGGRWRLG